MDLMDAGPWGSFIGLGAVFTIGILICFIGALFGKGNVLPCGLRHQRTENGERHERP